MKKPHRTITRLFLTSLVTIGTVSHGTEELKCQTRGVDCVAMVRGILKQVNEIDGALRTFYMKYTVRTIGTVRGRPVDNTSAIELTANRKRIEMRSSEADIYQDGTALVMVVPSARTIYVNTSDLRKLKEQKTKMMVAFQDSMLMHSDVLECVEIVDKAHNADRRLTLKMRPGARQMLGVNTVSYLINTRQQLIQQTVVKYVDGHDIASIEVNVNKVDYDYKAPPSSQPVLSEIYDGKGRLQAKYSGYNVIDSRNTRRN